VALSVVLDTNVVLYYLAGRLAGELPSDPICVSVVTEMEVLSFPGLTAEEEARIREFLEKLNVIGITPSVKEGAIKLRRQRKIRLPDAIVAATAIGLDATLYSNDTDLPNIKGLKVVRPTLRD
jgi:predicted nucleic acid-binding protein